jgi:two-component system sensor histidine kinase TtrS
MALHNAVLETSVVKFSMISYKTIFFLALVFFGRSAYAGAPSNQDKLVTIAVQSFLGQGIAHKKWQLSADYLSRTIPGYDFKIVIVEASKNELLYKMVDQQKVDYVIAQPVSSVVIQKLHQTKLELTRNDVKGISRFGSVIFTSVLNRSIHNTKSLNGKSFSAANPQGLGGWIVGLDYLTANNINPTVDFSDIQFLGNQDNIIFAVTNRLVDAGIVRTGVIETMVERGQLERSSIKILDQKIGFPYLLSTKLVPEWAFSSLQHTDPELTQQIKAALLDFKYLNGVSRWVEVHDYEPIRILLKKYRIAIYKDPFYIAYYRENYQYILFGLFILFYSLMYWHKRREEQIQAYKFQLEKLSKISSVDQLLSEVAHELAQPITSLKIDAHMLSSMLKDEKNCEFKQLKNTSNDINEKTQHCADLIHNIRQFLSKKIIKIEVFNVNKNIHKILRLVKNELIEFNINTKLSLSDNLPDIKMSSIELDQVLLNLAKNAISAMKDNRHQTNILSIESVYECGFVHILMTDSGSEIIDKDNLFSLFKTTKQESSTEGLGIGLSLSRRIIKTYQGELGLVSSTDEGTCFLIKLPAVKNNE